MLFKIKIFIMSLMCGILNKLTDSLFIHYTTIILVPLESRFSSQMCSSFLEYIHAVIIYALSQHLGETLHIRYDLRVSENKPQFEVASGSGYFRNFPPL